MRRRWWWTAALAAVGSCITISTDPHEVISIEFVELPWPAVVVGDTLRDQGGAVAPLSARLFEASGAEVTDAQIQFLSRDATVTIVNGDLVVGGSTTGMARLLASGAGLQSVVRQIQVVPRPDSLAPEGTIDTLRLVLPDSPQQNRSGDLKVKMVSVDAGGAATPVGSWIVSFALEFDGAPVAPGDTSHLYLADEAGRVSSSDTTDTQGIASRRIRFKVLPGTTIPPLDSVIVIVTASYRGSPLAGTPVRLVLPVTPK